jgi:hypothetical protein
MQRQNINTLAFRILISLGIAASSLPSIGISSVSAQSPADARTDCIKKSSAFYRTEQGGSLLDSEALSKAELTCANQSNSNIVSGNNEQSGPNIVAIDSCMKKLMYKRQTVCTRKDSFERDSFKQVCTLRLPPRCIPIRIKGGCHTLILPTAISESTAAKICQQQNREAFSK